MATSTKTNRMVGMAILIAIIVVLQIVGSFIRFGAFSVSLVLIPIVVGAAMYGAAAGAIFGGVFGAVVLISCISGADIGGNMLWVANPAATVIVCLLKGSLAGYAAGLVYSAFSKKSKYIGTMVAAFVCPVVNTGLFIAAMNLVYRDTLAIWAGGTALLYYSFIGLAGINFLIEAGVNIILSPTVVRIINAVKKA